MLCSWRSHRAEPGQLYLPPFFSSSSSPSPLPPSVGLEAGPESAHRKRFPAGSPLGEGQAKEGTRGEKQGGLATDVGGPMGPQPVALAGLGAGLEGGSQGPPLLGVGTEHTKVLLQLQGLGSPGQSSSTPGQPRL